RRLPLLPRPATEISTADETRLIVVRPVVGGTGMRNLDRDERDVGLAVFRRYDRCDLFVGLELDDQVDFFSYQHVGVALGHFRVVAIVDANQLNAFRGGRTL